MEKSLGERLWICYNVLCNEWVKLMLQKQLAASVQTCRNGDGLVNIANRLSSGRPPEEDFCFILSIQTDFGPSLLTSEYRRDHILEYCGRVVKLTSHLRLVWRWEMCGATPVLWYAFMAWCSLSTGKIWPFYCSVNTVTLDTLTTSLNKLQKDAVLHRRKALECQTAL